MYIVVTAELEPLIRRLFVGDDYVDVIEFAHLNKGFLIEFFVIECENAPFSRAKHSLFDKAVVFVGVCHTEGDVKSLAGADGSVNVIGAYHLFGR